MGNSEARISASPETEVADELEHSGVVLSGGGDRKEFDDDDWDSKEFEECSFPVIVVAHPCPLASFSKSSCRLILLSRIFSLIFSRSSSERIHSFFMPTSKHFFSRHLVQKRRVMTSIVQLSVNGHARAYCHRNRKLE